MDSIYIAIIIIGLTILYYNLNIKKDKKIKCTACSLSSICQQKVDCPRRKI